MNVSELYRELKMTKDEFFPLVKELGFDIGERAIKIDDRVAMKILAAIKERRKAGNKKRIFAEAEVAPVESKLTGNERVLNIPDKITVKQFADKLGKRVVDVIAVLMRNGFMATINETLDYETAAIIAEDMGYKPMLSLEGSEVDHADTRSEEISKIVGLEEKGDLVARAPVVVIMGHVDHGKTTLLDTIRKANVVAKESGGITQHIGAYQVEKKGKAITFIDTPGHEAFTTMRSRGARVADVAILVVAADDSIKPQTLEAIQIMQEAELPFIVAINKIDKPEADIEKVKRELSELNLVPEDWGGKTICVPISAKANKNIDDLLETLLLVADLDHEKIVANPNAIAAGSIIESHVDKHAGPVATVLVQNGTLHIGDIVLIGNIPGRVRSMKNWNGETVKVATPSMPVQVLGLKKAPIVGDILKVVTDKKVLKQHVKSFDTFSFLQKTKQKQQDEEGGKKKLALILRADKLGSLEAIIQSLQAIKHDEVAIDVIKKGLGSITESDVQVAKSAGAQILGFHVTPTSGAEKYARDEGAHVQLFEIIYQLIDYTKTELEKLLTAELTYNKVGTLKVLAIFKSGTHSTILGGRVEDGVFRTQAPVKIIRNGKMAGEGVIAQLQKNKKNTSEVTSGTECGLRVEGDTAVIDGDTLECYEAEEKQRTLGM
jgi:translation initiation factor IF-2